MCLVSNPTTKNILMKVERHNSACSISVYASALLIDAGNLFRE